MNYLIGAILVSWACSTVSSSLCSKEIITHVNSFKGNLVAERVPWGRKFLADNFHLALFYYKPEKEPESRCPNEKNVFYVRSCSTNSNTTNSGVLDVCSSVALHAELMGNEVAAAVNLTSRVLQDEKTSLGVCEWEIIFPHQMAAGNYSMFIWPRTINEFNDPTAIEIAADKNDRHNTGATVSLSGLGERNPTDLLPESVLDFTGHPVRKNSGKEIYLFINSTTYRIFNSLDAFLAGNYTFDDVYVLPNWFFDQRNAAWPGLSVQDMKSVPRPNPTTKEMSYKINGPAKLYFQFLEIASNESMIFELPTKITITDGPKGTDVDRSKVRLCRDANKSHLLSQGRWVLNPTCVEYFKYDSPAQFEFYGKFAHGDVCRQTEPSGYGDLPHRLRGLTWRPWDYDLVQFDVRNMYNAEIVHRLKQSSMCDIISSIDGSSRDTLQFSVATRQYLENSTNSGRSLSTSPPPTPETAPTAGIRLFPLPLCLRASGVGLIAGFGDSLGVEQYDNFRALLDNMNAWSSMLNAITCVGSLKTHLHSITSGPALIRCIEGAVTEMMKHASVMPLLRYNISHLPESASQEGEELVPVKSVVLITNFMAQHIGMKFTLKECVHYLREQATMHSDLALRLKTKFGLTYRRIFMTGVSIHGFKVSGLTTARQQWLAAEARKILGDEGGFEMFDVLNITAARPDAVLDGAHYKGGASKALTDVLVNILCVAPCANKT
jgi:hypothetical protein